MVAIGKGTAPDLVFFFYESSVQGVRFWPPQLCAIGKMLIPFLWEVSGHISGFDFIPGWYFSTQFADTLHLYLINTT